MVHTVVYDSTYLVFVGVGSVIVEVYMPEYTVEGGRVLRKYISKHVNKY